MKEEEYVKCIVCGKEHKKVEDTLAPNVEYYKIEGNVMANEVGGLIGNGDWEKNGTPEARLCVTCVGGIFRYQKYMSPKREHSLVTQETSTKSMLTVENYMKWYELFLILPNGQVISAHDLDIEDVTDSEGRDWYDHCPTPAYFHELAKHLGADYDNATFSAVCQRFVEDILDDDWTKLHKYLPK